MKFVDRGDEIVVDTSELLQLDKQSMTIPAFAQPFRLYNFDELVSRDSKFTMEGRMFVCSKVCRVSLPN